MRVRITALLLLVVGLAPTVSAQEPAVLEVLDADASVPTLLRTNIGLARAAGDGTYTYLCPSLWDGNELALAAAGDDAIGIFSNAAAFVSEDGGDSFVRVIEGGVRGVFVDPAGQLRVLAHEGMESVLYDRSGAVAEVFPGHLIDDLHVSGERWLATGTRPNAFAAVFDEGAWRVLGDLDGPASRIVIADVHEDTAMLVATSRERYVWAVTGLYSLPRREPYGPYETILGPVFDAGWFAALDGQRTSFGGGVWLDEGPADWTALQRDRRGTAWAMRFGEVRRVDDDTLRFSFAQLGPPSSPACDLDWAHFGGESGWLDSAPATTPGGARTPHPSSGGCAAGSSRGGAALVCLLLALGRRRR